MTGRSGRVWRKSLDEIEPGIVLGIEGEFEGVAGFAATLALVSLEMCAARLSRMSLIAVLAG
jgi:hypothetical protein